MANNVGWHDRLLDACRRDHIRPKRTSSWPNTTSPPPFSRAPRLRISSELQTVKQIRLWDPLPHVAATDKKIQGPASIFGNQWQQTCAYARRGNRRRRPCALAHPSGTPGSLTVVPNL